MCTSAVLIYITKYFLLRQMFFLLFFIFFTVYAFIVAFKRKLASTSLLLANQFFNFTFKNMMK